MTRSFRRVGAWFAIIGLLLQVGLSTAHSARHFDHLVGHLLPAASPGSAELSSNQGAPSPSAPTKLDHCAIDLGLAASGSFMLPDAATVPLPPGHEAAGLGGQPQTIAAGPRRHLLPPARAPPVELISV
jgi:hypothetical protein